MNRRDNASQAHNRMSWSIGAAKTAESGAGGGGNMHRSLWAEIHRKCQLAIWTGGYIILMVDLFFRVFLLRGPIRKSGSWRSAAPVRYGFLATHGQIAKHHRIRLSFEFKGAPLPFHIFPSCCSFFRSQNASVVVFALKLTLRKT
jgi:hypothetical protein